MSERKTRVAVVGVGNIAKSAHIPAYLANPYVDLVAIVDVNEKQLSQVGKKFKVKKTYTCVDKLFENEEIDALSICTPPNSHAEIALKAFNYGANVLCEKPLATNIDDGKKMVSAAKKCKKFFMIGFHRRFLPNYQRARKNILSGRLGHVYCVQDNFIEPNPLLAYSKSRWFFEENIGGVILDIAPHVFDMLNYMYDDFPIAISAQSSTHFGQPVEDCFVFSLEYPKGRLGLGITSWLSPTVIENLNIHGTSQNLFVSPDFFLNVNPNAFRQIGLLKAAGESLISMKFPNLSFIKTKAGRPYQNEINYFIRCIRDGKTSQKNALNGLSVLLTTEMAKKSIEEKKRIQISHPNDLI